MTSRGYFGFSIRNVLIKVLPVCAALAICSLVLVGCKSGDANGGDEVTDSVPESTFVSDIGVPMGGIDPEFSAMEVTTDNIFEFVTLGQYKGVEYDPVTPASVTDDEIEEIIKSELSQWCDMVVVTDRAVQMNDIVIIDFEGFIDGVAFPNGAADGASLTIGAGQFIPGFDEAIIGHTAGEEFEINLTFPEEYPNSPELAGKPAVFKIVLYTIYEEIMPLLTDAFVQENLDMDTAAEYRASIKKQLEQERQQSAKLEVENQIWGAVFDAATFHKYPQSEIDFMIDMVFAEIEYLATTYGATVEDIIGQYTGMSLEDYMENELMPNTIHDVGFDLILRAIAVHEGIVISDEEFDRAVVSFTLDYGYEDAEHFLSEVGRHTTYIVLISPEVENLVMSSAIARSRP